MSSPTAAEGNKWGLDIIRRDVMSSQPGEGDKLSALHAPDTDDDDGCEEQGKGVGAACPKIDQDGMRKKKLRRDGEALNLSQQQREERQSFILLAAGCKTGCIISKLQCNESVLSVCNRHCEKACKKACNTACNTCNTACV